MKPRSRSPPGKKTAGVIAGIQPLFAAKPEPVVGITVGNISVALVEAGEFTGSPGIAWVDGIEEGVLVVELQAVMKNREISRQCRIFTQVSSVIWL